MSLPNRRFIDTLEPRRFFAAGGGFSFSMADRFGLDGNGDGRVDLPNTAAYADPGTFTVQFQATPNPRAGGEVVDYRWAVFPVPSSRRSPPVATLTGAAPAAQLPEGTYNVALSTTDAAGRTRMARRKVIVDDILVVSLGDSYASGEGNPEVRGGILDDVEWAWSSDPAVREEHRQAHRSTLAGPAQAALLLERRDPRTSVTFVSLAQSGATIEAGLLGGKAGSDDGDVMLPAQLDQLAAVVGQRDLDAVTLSIGGNDIGFVDIAVDFLSSGFDDADLAELSASVQRRLGEVSADLRRVGDRLRTDFGPRLKRVFLTEYPDPTGDDSGAVGDPVLGIFPLEISAAEGTFARTEILAPLNKTLAAAARQNRWRFAGGVAAGSRTHGYPASESWFVSVTESLARQGTVSGAVHPNEDGHAFVAGRLAAAIVR